MSAIKNLVIRGTQEELIRQLEEYKFIGREAELDLSEGKLTVFALPRSYKKKRVAEAKLAARRQSDDDDYS